jgi:hypothetical protein
MEPLVLRFADGKVEGEGVDVIGPFTFRGTYDETGAVSLVKQYLGAHQVLYHGRHDGEGTLYGQWTVAGIWTGPFALRPERFTVAADAPILTISASPTPLWGEDVPAEEIQHAPQPQPSPGSRGRRGRAGRRGPPQN